MKKKTVRDKFVIDFGDALAVKIESAAQEHGNGINNKTVGDRFKWALLICIGYQCLEREEYRHYHGIPATPKWNKIKQWIRDNGELATYKGDCDYLSLMSGAYTWFINKGVK